MNTESSSMQEFLEQIRRDAPDNLVIHNPDSNILQLYELNTPFMIDHILYLPLTDSEYTLVSSLHFFLPYLHNIPDTQNTCSHIYILN